MPALPPDPTPRRLLARRTGSAAGVFAVVLVCGVIGYLALGRGRWGLFDALYMAVITLSTVGYGELEGMSEVPGARLFTLVLILAGTGSMIYMTSAMTALLVEGDLRGALRRRTMDRRIDALQNHTILAGLGSTGSQVALELARSGVEFVVIEQDSSKLERFEREHGISPLHLLADATEERALQRAGITRASGLVAALADDRDNLFLTFTARAIGTKLRIVAKAVEPDNHGKLARAGADEVVSPTFIGGRRMASSLLRPRMVGFLDDLRSDDTDPHSLEDLPIRSGAAWDGVTLAASSIRDRFDATAIAVRRSDGSYQYGPTGSFQLQAGMALIALVPVEKVASLQAESRREA